MTYPLTQEGPAAAGRYLTREEARQIYHQYDSEHTALKGQIDRLSECVLAREIAEGAAAAVRFADDLTSDPWTGFFLSVAEQPTRFPGVFCNARCEAEGRIAYPDKSDAAWHGAQTGHCHAPTCGQWDVRHEAPLWSPQNPIYLIVRHRSAALDYLDGYAVIAARVGAFLIAAVRPQDAVYCRDRMISGIRVLGAREFFPTLATAVTVAAGLDRFERV